MTPLRGEKSSQLQIELQYPQTPSYAKSMNTAMIAALFVESHGSYSGLEGVDLWDEARDARTYDGPYPVIAHPPCERWGNYWYGGPSWVRRGLPPKKLGDDGGCFEAALRAVRRTGGVLEHPSGSRAWSHFGINRPEAEGWVKADFEGGWTCRVDQGHYGHRARKPTWLYAVGCVLPPLKWGKSDPPPISQRAAERGEGNCIYLSRKERAATPIEFRDLLISIVRSGQ